MEQKSIDFLLKTKTLNDYIGQSNESEIEEKKRIMEKTLEMFFSQAKITKSNKDNHLNLDDMTKEDLAKLFTGTVERLGRIVDGQFLHPAIRAFVVIRICEYLKDFFDPLDDSTASDELLDRSKMRTLSELDNAFSNEDFIDYLRSLNSD